MGQVLYMLIPFTMVEDIASVNLEVDDQRHTQGGSVFPGGWKPPLETYRWTTEGIRLS